MKKIIFVAILFFTLIINASSEIFEVNGINYQTTSIQTVEVIQKTPKYQGDIAIPAYIHFNDKTFYVTKISWEAFKDCDALTSVTLTNNINDIGSSAFNNCPNLTSVIIGNNIKTIGANAFSDCGKLASIILPYSLIQIGD